MKVKPIMLTEKETYMLNKIRECKANMNEAFNCIEDRGIAQSVVKGLNNKIKKLEIDLNVSLELRVRESD